MFLLLFLLLRMGLEMSVFCRQPASAIIIPAPIHLLKVLHANVKAIYTLEFLVLSPLFLWIDTLCGI
jgi:hypothetical protein